MEFHPFVLENQIQHYLWGTKGKNAFIPKLLNIPAVPDIPYAELWMGAHPKAPSIIQMNHKKIPLNKAIRMFPKEMIGEAVFHQSAPAALPFLFKVLSAAQALSIQVHPNKKQAKKLHRLHPEHYPDDNQKPEIAIALDQLTALIGLRPICEIQSMLEKTPEIFKFIRSHPGASFHQRDAINDSCLFFKRLMTGADNKRELNQTLNDLKNRLYKQKSEYTDHEQLFLDLRKLYPGPDIGLLAVFFLNLINLKSGQGIFLDSGIPHSYIRGNIIECMANSDNVIRAGLTGKFRDIKTLTQVIRYDNDPVHVIEPDKDRSVFVYPVPAAEFQVTRIILESGRMIRQEKHNKPAILLCVKGSCQLSWPGGKINQKLIIQQGQSVFFPAILKSYGLTASDDICLFQATPPV